MGGGGGNKKTGILGSTGAVSETDAIRNDELARQERIRTGTKKIEDMFGSQFNDAYFNKQRDNYTGYALPQLADQTKNTAKQLTFALDRRGALDSSSRSSLETDLEKKRALAETEIRDRANDYRTQTMAGVEGARGDLINTLNATGDVQGAVNSATARAKVLSQPPAYSPIAQAFVDFTAGLGQQAAAEKAFAYGAGPRPAISTGLFGPRTGAVVNG